MTTPFSAGDCTGLNGTALSDCLEARIRCRTCLTETISDALTFDCDLYDDGDTENSSCFDQS